MVEEPTEETTKTLEELFIEMVAAVTVLGNLSAELGMKMEECNERLGDAIAATQELAPEKDLRGLWYKTGVVQGCCFGAIGAIQALNEMVHQTLSTIVASEQVKRPDEEKEGK